MTTFTFTATKADGQKYLVNLNQDILKGISSDDILVLAEHSKIVEVQNHKGSILRASVNATEARKTLYDMGYTEAEVEVYVPTTKPKVLTVEDIKKSIASGKMTKAEVLAFLEALK